MKFSDVKNGSVWLVGEDSPLSYIFWLYYGRLYYQAYLFKTKISKEDNKKLYRFVHSYCSTARELLSKGE